MIVNSYLPKQEQRDNLQRIVDQITTLESLIEDICPDNKERKRALDKIKISVGYCEMSMMYGIYKR